MGQSDTIKHDIIMPVEAGAQRPIVRDVELADLATVLSKGWSDFRAMPTHVIFLGLLYPTIGIALFWAMHSYSVIPLLYPAAAGFALVGPFAAIGLYELSRRRELGLETTWSHAFDVVHSPSLGAILRLGLLLLAVFFAWLIAAQALFATRFDVAGQQLSLTTLVQQMLTTPEGRDLIIYGNLIGFGFAVLVFLLNVVSFPMLLDRHVGASVAMATSFEVVRRNPLTMAVWAAIVAGLLVLGSLPALLGLAVVVPVLGHATWHLYRSAVEPSSGPRPAYDPPEKGTRYAADFPASLFTRTPPRR